MWLSVYLLGIVAIGFVVASCFLAREGNQGAESASVVGSTVLLVISLLGVLVSLLLMLTGQKISEEGGIWTRGQGQQFVAALAGFAALLVAGSFIRQRRYVGGAMLIIFAGCLFGLWGLLVEAGWSNRGPLALLGG